MEVSVIGAGGWGTTLANLLAEKGIETILWAREPEVVREIEENRTNNQFLPGVKLSIKIKPTNNLENAVRDKKIIIMAIPSQFLRVMAKKITGYIKTDAIVVDVAKGIEEGTFKRMSQILEEELPSGVRIIALSGPNHAEEVSRKIPTATVIASKHSEILTKIKELLEVEYFKVYPHDDIIGVEICGAIKNISAIATGVCDGLGLGNNSKASIITLGLMEMSKVGRFFGARRSTFYGLAGVGDLVATCMSKYSRNRFVGEKIAEGKSLDEIKKEMHGMIAEGVKTTKAVYELSKKENMDLPLTNQVYKVLYEKKELKSAIKDLIELI